MHRLRGKSHSGYFLLAALLSAGILAAHAGFAADTTPDKPPASSSATGDPHRQFTDAEQKTLMEFLLEHDGGREAHHGVVALVRQNHHACAVTLVMDTYAVPKETASLFVELVAGGEQAPGR